MASGASLGTKITCGNVSGTNNIQLSLPEDLILDSPTNSLIIANWNTNTVARLYLDVATVYILLVITMEQVAAHQQNSIVHGMLP